MSWRTDQAYEDAEREDYRRWLMALTPGQRLKHRVERFFPLAACLALSVAAVVYFSRW